MGYTNQVGEPSQKLKGLANDIQALMVKVNNDYIVPPKFENLQTIINRCNTITTKGYAIQTGQENASASWEQFQANLPG